MAEELKAQLINGVDSAGARGGSPVVGSAVLNDSDRRIEMIAVAQLKPHPRNPRTHSRKQIRQIAKSIEKFGFNAPILVDDHDQIIAGHGRLEAAKLVGLTEIPTCRLSHMSEADVRGYLIADNKLAQLAGWDREIVVEELECLIDRNFDLEVVGFAPGEVEVVLDDSDEAKREAAGPEDQIPELGGPAVSRVGDLWIVGKHRIVCGDARDNSVYGPLLDGEKAELVFTDPPYNVPIDGHVCGKGSIHHRDFPMAAGEMSSQEFAVFLETVFALLVTHSTDGSIHFACMDWRHLAEILAAGKVYTELKNVIAWVKTNAGMGTFYRSRHELIFVFKSGTAPHVNGFQLGQHGRNRTNVWQYPGISSLGAARTEQLSMHPTVKPVALVADALKDCSHRNGIVLDSFAGSGTILIAAERTGRRARGIEIDPLYVDTAVRRWQKYSGKVATLAATGQSFEEVEEERSATAKIPSTASGSEGA